MAGTSHVPKSQTLQDPFFPSFRVTSHKLSSLSLSLQMPNSQLAMETHPTNSELSLLSTSESVSPESEKAWHLFALLLSLGRPARPDELASRCTLFSASSGLVEFLCLIPKSPIFLTDHRFVTMSSVGLTALGNFVSNSNLIDLSDVFLPARIGIGEMRNLCADITEVYFRKRKRRVSDGEFMPVVKRRAIWDSGDRNEEDRLLLHSPNESRNAFNMTQYHIFNAIRCSLNTQPNDMSILEFDSIRSNRAMVMPPLFVNSIAGQSSCELNNIENVGENHVDVIAQRKVHGSVCTSEHKHSFGDIKVFPDTLNPTSLEIIMARRPDLEPTLPPRELDDPVVYKEAKTDGIHLRSRSIVNTVVCREEVKESNIPQAETWNIKYAREDTTVRMCEIERMKPDREEELFIDSGSPKGGIRNLSQPFNTDLLDKEPTAANAESQAIFPETEVFAPEKQLTELKTTHTPRKRALFKPLEHSKAVSTPKENQHSKRDQISIGVPKKLKQNRNDTHIEEKKGNASSVPLKDQLEPKVLPNFESFIVEEEEGSGGYGIVYRARRKTDGSTVAIKCPHANAHRHHVNNELKMLEQFGGKNFVIKYEGCFENGNCSCFVLEHVEHDRPEVLKKEMDVFQLQWYGYCMFRALASLHKEGVVHRDVKPGNFLFSRKANKGYLIDFNLALDLDQKYGTIDKSKAAYDVSINRVTLPHVKSVPPTKSNKFPGNKSLEAVNWEASKNSKPTLEPKNLKKRSVGQTKANNELGKQNIVKSQGADGSGITSAKDLRSTRTPSAERLREPLPCKGRKELISLLQNAMQSPNNEASSIPAPMRKRVSAPAGKLDKRLAYLTPMPLHSPGISFSSAGLTKGKGGGKHKKEGPCVGTKGFRAPEVLFRSLHQGPKVDIWSAGVTLLYLMIGRAPFVGDPEQNIKDIARLRGSEDLWEVAKLHNRESSFSKELYDTQFLPPMKLRDWCKMNTRRPAFVEEIPRSLFDLVDKCLMVNPRVRISAEEALKHEFFTPCHESLRRQRMRRQGLSLDRGTSYPLDGQSIKVSY